MQNKIGHPVHLTVPISKIDEEQRMVWGYATVEEMDAHGEVIGYEASKKAFEDWPGNIREMHDPIAVGINKEITYDDENKGVWIGAYISESDDGNNAWTKVKEGVLQGFSIGGSIKDYEVIEGEAGKPVVKVTDYSLDEVSLVDNPACPSAMFQMVKSAGGRGLVRTERMLKADARPVAWWEGHFHFSSSQQVMKRAGMPYNENSMAKQKTLAKSLWSAMDLTDLALCLSDYIWWKSWSGEGDGLEELKGAVDTIKAQAARELGEPEDYPEVQTAIENATKALNITKREDLTKMAEEKKAIHKSTVGQEDRNDAAEVVTSAEENGRPLNDTPERAAENDLPVAGAEDEDGNVQPLVNDAASPAGEGDENVPDDKAAASKTNVAVKPDEKKDGKVKNAAAPKDIQKSAPEGDLAAQILKGVGTLIDEKLKPMQEELDTLKGKPAISKAKASFTDVDKGEDVNDKKTETPAADDPKAQFDALQKRADELAADPFEGTPQERIQMAVKLRKLSTQMDPRRMAEHDAIRAQFNTSN